MHTNATLPPAFARTAGALYLLIAVVGAFAIAYVPSIIFVSGDAAATAENLLANKGLFGAGALADVIMMVSEVVLTAMLYVIFRPVSPTLSLAAATMRLMMVVVMAFNLLINLTPLLLLSGANYLGAFSTEQLQATSLLLIEIHGYGVFIWDIFFGLHLMILGYLILKSGFVPRLLGAAMLVGSFGYTLEGLVKVTFFENELVGMAIVGLLVIASLSEIFLAFWLLIRGINLPARARFVAQPAAA